jgi:hypothetical protein
MSDRDEKETPGDAKGKPVHCRRTGQDYQPHEHQRCPYCWGEKKEVETGEHQEFCDYDPKKDPISFGFPPDGSRQQSG